MKGFRLLGSIGIVAVLITPFFVQAIDRHTAVAVTSVSVQPRIVRDLVSASGSLIYEREARLSPEVLGRVLNVLVEEGDHVEKGQVILRIDDEPLRVTVDQQEAALKMQESAVERQRLVVADARRRLERAQGLHAEGFMSKSDFDQLEFNLQIAESDLRQRVLEVTRARAVLLQAKQQVERTIIRAPMNGSVIAVGIKPGETAVPSATGIPGSSLVTIADLNTIVADLNVDESDIARLKVGQTASIFCPPLPDTSLNGTIKTIALAPRSDSAGPRDGGARNYSVKVNFSDTRLTGLRPGMECRATIYTSPAVPELAVPVQAIQSNRTDDVDGYSAPSLADGKATDFVFVDQGGIVRKRIVTLGLADSSYQQVLSGLSAGDQVVIGPYRTLLTLIDGQRVRRAAYDEVAGL